MGVRVEAAVSAVADNKRVLLAGSAACVVSAGRLETSEESTPGSDSDNDVGGSLEDDVVSTGGRTPPVLGTGR